jgi:hypothetical protein
MKMPETSEQKFTFMFEMCGPGLSHICKHKKHFLGKIEKTFELNELEFHGMRDMSSGRLCPPKCLPEYLNWPTAPDIEIPHHLWQGTAV